VALGVTASDSTAINALISLVTPDFNGRLCNNKQTRMGHLFQGRYKAILVDANNYLVELVHYMHLNPVRAGMVEDPQD
jgi:REP element-mobilizing transposase RayT